MAKIINSEKMEWKKLGEAIRARIVTGKNITVQIVNLKKGATMEPHYHIQEQLGYVLKGKAKFVCGETKETFIVEPGMFFFFESNESHGLLEAIQDTLIIDVFGPVRDDYLSLAVPLTD